MMIPGIGSKPNTTHAQKDAPSEASTDPRSPGTLPSSKRGWSRLFTGCIAQTDAKHYDLSQWCVILALCLIFSPLAHADNVENHTINSKINIVTATQLTPPAAGSQLPADLSNTEPYKSGFINVNSAKALIDRLRKATLAPGAPPLTPDTAVTIIHVLRWGSADHSTVAFQKWYVYDPNPPKSRSYFISSQSQFQDKIIAGRTSFRLIYVHLNYDLTNNSTESTKTDVDSGLVSLVYPVTYKVAVTEQQTQFLTDLTSLLSLLGVVQTAAVASSATDPIVGYFSLSEFTSQYKTSSIAVAVSHSDTNKSNASAATSIGNQTYTNEGPSWIGLSIAVPLTSYKTLTYSQTDSVITTNTINQQNIYAMVDFYLPPVEPAWTKYRFIPHPIFGMPIKKQPLRNTTAGLAIGLKYLQPFGCVVFNVQQRKTSGNTLVNHLVFKGAWGITISLTDAAKLIKASSTNKTASTTATKAASSP